MIDPCPVCADPVEHVRVETPGGDSAEGTTDAVTTVDVEDICAMDADTRWDRICHEASVESQSGPTPVLVAYYHFFDGEEMN